MLPHHATSGQLDINCRSSLGAIRISKGATPRYRNDPYSARVLPPLATNQSPPSCIPRRLIQSVSSAPVVSQRPLPKISFATKMKHVVATSAEVFNQYETQQIVFAEDTISITEHNPVFAYVRFKYDSCCYACPFLLQAGDTVVVEGDRGYDVGVTERVQLTRPQHPVPLKVLRFASEDEVLELANLRLRERQLTDHVQALANSLNLVAMRVVDVESQFDGNKMTVFFQARCVVDFRALQRALFRTFGCRIWLSNWNEE